MPGKERDRQKNKEKKKVREKLDVGPMFIFNKTLNYIVKNIKKKYKRAIQSFYFSDGPNT